MSWEDQGRQQHGWFGHGTSTNFLTASPFSPDAVELAAGGDPRKQLMLQRLIERFWSGGRTTRPIAPAGPPQSSLPPKIVGPPVQQIPPERLRFSQTTAGGNGGTERVSEYIAKNGTIQTPVDVVRTPDGLVTIDNTRVAVAREMGLSRIPVRIWEPSDPIPAEFGRRFEDSQNWGEVLAERLNRQQPPLPATGTSALPVLRGKTSQ